MAEEFIEVATKNKILNGSGKIFNVKGVSVAIFNVDGEFYAINNKCPHRGGPLGEGYLSGSIVTCPWHAWEFDVKTGQSPVSEQIRIPSYKVRVEGEKILVSLE